MEGRGPLRNGRAVLCSRGAVEQVWELAGLIPRRSPVRLGPAQPIPSHSALTALMVPLLYLLHPGYFTFLQSPPGLEAMGARDRR